jgi:hypothetical protein
VQQLIKNCNDEDLRKVFVYYINGEMTRRSDAEKMGYACKLHRVICGDYVDAMRVDAEDATAWFATSMLEWMPTWFKEPIEAEAKKKAEEDKREQLQAQGPLDFENEGPELIVQLKAKHEALKVLKVETEKKVANARASYLKVGPVLSKGKVAIEKAAVCRKMALKLVAEGDKGAMQTQKSKGADGEEILVHIFADGSRVQRMLPQGAVQVVLAGNAGVYQAKEATAAQNELVVLGDEQIMWAGAGGAAGASAGSAPSVYNERRVPSGRIVWATCDGNRVIAADNGVMTITASACSGCHFQVQADPTDAQLLQVDMTSRAEEETVQLIAAVLGGAKRLNKTQEGYGLVSSAGSKMQVDGDGNFTAECRGEDGFYLCANGDLLITRQARTDDYVNEEKKWRFSGSELVVVSSI